MSLNQKNKKPKSYCKYCKLYVLSSYINFHKLTKSHLRLKEKDRWNKFFMNG